MCQHSSSLHVSFSHLIWWESDRILAFSISITSKGNHTSNSWWRGSPSRIYAITNTLFVSLAFHVQVFQNIPLRLFYWPVVSEGKGCPLIDTECPRSKGSAFGVRQINLSAWALDHVASFSGGNSYLQTQAKLLDQNRINSMCEMLLPQVCRDQPYMIHLNNPRSVCKRSPVAKGGSSRCSLQCRCLIWRN